MQAAAQLKFWNDTLKMVVSQMFTPVFENHCGARYSVSAGLRMVGRDARPARV
jgi:hypothetical protein